MKKYLYLLIIIIMSSLAVQAQQNETVIEYNVAKVKEIDIEDEELIEGERGVIYLNKKKYKTRKINSNCAIYYKESSNKLGIIKNGKRLLPNIFDNLPRYNKEMGDKIVLKIRKRTYTGIYGVFDLVHEKWILPLEYHYIKKLEGDYYAVKKDYHYIIQDLKSKKIIANKKWKSIEKINDLGSGYYKVAKDNDSSYGVYSIISKKTIIPCLYKSLRYEPSLNYFKVYKDNKYNYVNVKNQFLFKNWYEYIKYEDGFFIVKKDGKKGIVDRDEKEIAPIKYLMIKYNDWSDTKSHLAQNELGKYGFLSLDGTVTLPFIYDEIKLNYSYAKLKSADDKYGLLINRKGKMKIVSSCQYDDINVKYHFFIVVKDGKYGLLNYKEEKVVEEKYDYIDELKSYVNNDGFVLKKGNNYFLFANGKIFKEKYKDIKSLKAENGRFVRYLALKSNTNKYGLMDSVNTGKMVTPFMFDDIIYKIKDDYFVVKNYFVVKIGKKMGIYDILNQKMIVQAKYDNIIKGDSFFYGIKDSSKVTIIRF